MDHGQDPDDLALIVHFVNNDVTPAPIPDANLAYECNPVIPQFSWY